MNDKKHTYYFLLLFLGLAIGFLLFFTLRYNQMYQFYSVIGMVIYYILWGFFHHYEEDRLDFYIISEYLLIGSVVILLFAIVLGV